MAQIHDAAPSGTSILRRNGPSRVSAIAAMTLGLAILFALAMSAFLLAGRPQAPAAQAPAAEAPVPQAQTDAAVVDGWMPGITAANRERAIERANGTLDGWSSYLLVREQPVVDGWAARYLVSDDE